MKKRLFILMMLVVGTFFFSFGQTKGVSGAYCPYMNSCDNSSQCGDCYCKTICDPRTRSCERVIKVCGT